MEFVEFMKCYGDEDNEYFTPNDSYDGKGGHNDQYRYDLGGDTFAKDLSDHMEHDTEAKKSLVALARLGLAKPKVSVDGGLTYIECYDRDGDLTETDLNGPMTVYFKFSKPISADIEDEVIDELCCIFPPELGDNMDADIVDGNIVKLYYGDRQ